MTGINVAADAFEAAKHQSDVPATVKQVLALLERSGSGTVRAVRSDRGGECWNKALGNSATCLCVTGEVRTPSLYSLAEPTVRGTRVQRHTVCDVATGT